MPAFKNLDQLYDYLRKQIADSMEKDIAEKVIEVEQKHIQTDVYNVYPDPKQYERTYKLIDRSSFEVEKIEDGIAITNVTYHDGKYIPEVIETGEGYDYTGYGYTYEQPRPFVEKTVEDLEQNGQHIEELKKSLNRKGIRTK